MKKLTIMQLNVETVGYHKTLFNQETDFCNESKKRNYNWGFRSPMNEARDPSHLPACEKNKEQEKT